MDVDYVAHGTDSGAYDARKRGVPFYSYGVTMGRGWWVVVGADVGVDLVRRGRLSVRSNIRR